MAVTARRAAFDPLTARELPERVEKEEWVQLSNADTAAYREAVMKREISVPARSCCKSAKSARIK